MLRHLLALASTEDPDSTYSVHNVDMEPIGIVLDDRCRALLAQAAKVGTQYGWRNDRWRRHDDLQEEGNLALPL